MILKSEIEKTLVIQNAILKEKSIGIQRNELTNIQIHSGLINIISGIRRSGKSTLMLQLASVLEKEYVFFNFDDPRIFGFDLNDFLKLNELIEGKAEYLFFDEIQVVKNWEVAIQGLHDAGKKIILTGSNASLLSQELGTKLTGRYIRHNLFPFSYPEFLLLTEQMNHVGSFTQFIEKGGIADFLKTNNTAFHQQLFKDIIYRDIAVRYGVRNTNSLVELALYLISNVGNKYSLNRLKNLFEFGATNTVSNYIGWFEDCYLLFSLPKFSWSAKRIANNAKKIYCIDTGFARSNSLSFTEDEGRLFENAIYIELRRRYDELYYFAGKGECDFVACQNHQPKILIQACTNINSENQKREISGLVEAMDFFSLTEGYIITIDQEDVIWFETKKISLIPGWKWFCSNE
jgi:uncharacterized protein